MLNYAKVSLSASWVQTISNITKKSPLYLPEVTGFPVLLEELRPFVIKVTHSSCGDSHFLGHFKALQRQSGAMQPTT